jgi:DNA transposition AAA+ family ATPase
MASCRTVLYTPTVANSARSVEKEVDGLHVRFNCLIDQAMTQLQGEDREVERDYCALLLVDEADRLKTASLEQLRDFYDRTQLGLVLIGMPGLEKRLARYPQLFSRIGFAHQFRPLSRDELIFILTQKWDQLGLTLEPTDFTDAEAVAAVIRITGGNFRLLQRLFAQIERILQINALHTITQEVVETAREGLVIGVI